MSGGGLQPADRRLIRVLGALVALLLWAQLLSRAAGLKHLGPVRWPTDLYAAALLDEGELDLLILGSSRAAFGLAPTAIDPCLSGALGRPARSWSWSRANASLWSQRLVAREALRRLRPRLVVVEVAPEMMNPRHYEQAWNAVTEAEVEDIGACLQGAFDAATVGACFFPLVRPLDNLARTFERAPSAPPQLRWMALHARGGQFCFGSPACVAHNARFEERLRFRWDDRLAEVIPKVRAERFRDYRVGPPHTDAMLALLAEIEAVGARPLLLRMPVHAVYAEQIPTEAEAEFSAYLSSLRAQTGAPLLDAGGWWSTERARFHDPDHLSPAGAEALSGALCAAAAPLLGGPPSPTGR